MEDCQILPLNTRLDAKAARCQISFQETSHSLKCYDDSSHKTSNQRFDASTLNDYFIGKKDSQNI
jgi:hypothetical protein